MCSCGATLFNWLTFNSDSIVVGELGDGYIACDITRSGSRDKDDELKNREILRKVSLLEEQVKGL